MMESYSKHKVFPPQRDPFLTPTPSEISGRRCHSAPVFPPLLSSRGASCCRGVTFLQQRDGTDVSTTQHFPLRFAGSEHVQSRPGRALRRLGFWDLWPSSRLSGVLSLASLPPSPTSVAATEEQTGTEWRRRPTRTEVACHFLRKVPLS